ncbi:MAG: FxsA family protein [Acidimicrobiia bacterium]|nr:FxsA family protein [Acidimicrobiia bacterium]
MLLVFLILALVVVPLIELFVIIQVGQWIGFLPTILLLIVISIAGGFLVKREGLSAWRRAQAQLRAGEIPAAELVDGALIMAAGAMLLTPGFVTDAIGVLLLIPAMRFLPRRWAQNHRATRTTGRVYGRVIDVRGTAGPDPADRPAIEPPPSPPPDAP